MQAQITHPLTDQEFDDRCTVLIGLRHAITSCLEKYEERQACGSCFDDYWLETAHKCYDLYRRMGGREVFSELEKPAGIIE